MNKNPERPMDIDEIISNLLNPKPTDMEIYKKKQKELLEDIFK